MDLSELPATAFIDPAGGNRQEISRLFQQIMTVLLDHLANADRLPPLPAENAMPVTTRIPERGKTEQELLDDLGSILTSSMNAASRGCIGHMDTMPTTISILGEMVSAALNNNMLSLEMSPLFSRLEEGLLKEFAGLFGLGKQAGGVMLSGGTLANLQALTVARNRTLGSARRGLMRLKGSPVIFASEAAHTSLQKAAMLLGIGTDAVIGVPTNRNSQMDTVALEYLLIKSKARGDIPFCVVATVGTTTTGNIDPLPGIAKISKKYGLWFHVDAAYGGAMAFSDRERWRLNGIEFADSITFNPQKWLYVTKTCVMLLFSDFSILDEAMRIKAPYMRDDGGFINRGEISVQGTRHTDILKLWLSMQHLGASGYRQLVDESRLLTEYFVSQIRKREYLELASEPETNIICFRGRPSSLTDKEQDQWNSSLQTFLLKSCKVFLSLPVYRGRKWLRTALLNPYTDHVIVDRLFEHLDNFANQC